MTSSNTEELLVSLAPVLGLKRVGIGAGIGPARQARRTEPAPLLREE